MKAPIPAKEEERLEALQRFRILDSCAEQIYDDIVELASFICNTPVALVSLVDRDRQWFKARKGLDASETSRDLAFCAHAILDTEILIVPDATKDTRFAANPLVTGAPGIRFYAGAPLMTREGHGLGTLCVIDQSPRELTDNQASALKTLSRQVMTLFEYRLTSQQLAEALDHLETLRELLPICAYCKKIRDDQGYWESVEQYFTRHAQKSFSHGICPDCAEKHFPEVAPFSRGDTAEEAGTGA